jgi:ABC-type multidrug transport system ATPase subunit
LHSAKRAFPYCEQTDIHSPNVTVFESITYSAWLRLSSDIDDGTKKVKATSKLFSLNEIYFVLYVYEIPKSNCF